MARDFYVQPDAADPVLDTATVLAIVRRHAPNVVTVTAVDESGGEARTYAFDDDLILKVQRHESPTGIMLATPSLCCSNEENCCSKSVARSPCFLVF